jgi:hypothetical protein
MWIADLYCQPKHIIEKIKPRMILSGVIFYFTRKLKEGIYWTFSFTVLTCSPAIISRK